MRTQSSMLLSGCLAAAISTIACLGVDARRTVASAQTEAAVPAPRAETPPRSDADLRLLVMLATGQNESDLATAVASLYGPGGSFEPLFVAVEASPAMRRMYLVHGPRLAPAVNAWDEAYRLRDAGGFEEVQPDRADVLEERTHAELADLRCFSDPGIPAPADHDWALKKVRALRAWDVAPPPGGQRGGAGVRVCHPDTGWADHDELDASRLDLASAANILEGGSDAKDSLDYDFPLASRGHGTATGSVIMSGPLGSMKGVAPAATLVPIRTARSVVRVWDSQLARAVAHATRVRCDVISISLGGPGFFGLKAAIDQAVSEGMIVVAAAGNCVRLVVAPAHFENTIAVAATNADDAPWHGSCRGSAVDVSAPGEDVYRAFRDLPGDGTVAVSPSDGTSYATAMVAGAAALWLAHHGRSAIEAARRPGETVSDVFRRLLVASADHSAGGWNASQFGAGILDVFALLQADLGSGAGRDDIALAMAARSDNIALLARVLDRDAASTRASLVAMMPGHDPNRFAAEVLELAFRDPEGVSAILDARETGPDAALGGSPRVRNIASMRLNAALR